MKREEILNTLDSLYDKVLQGVPPKREGAVAMAERYLRKNDSVDDAALDLIPTTSAVAPPQALFWVWAAW